jgi:hypothetical protein
MAMEATDPDSGHVVARVSKISRFEKYRETGNFFAETGKNREI